MNASRPAITRLSEPANIIGLDLIKEFIGLEPEQDANQDQTLSLLCRAAIDRGQQFTGIVWPEAEYRIDGLIMLWPGGEILLPLAQVSSLLSVEGQDPAGKDVEIPEGAYSFIPSAIDMGRPYALLVPSPDWPGEILTLSVTCVAGWTEETLPDGIKGWLLSMTAALFDMPLDGAVGALNAPRTQLPVGLLDRWTVRNRAND